MSAPAHPHETTVAPYLFFDGRCDEAIAFYQEVLGAELIMRLRFQDSPEPHQHPPGFGEKVMHARLRIGRSTLLCSDGHCGGKAVFQGFGLSATVPDVAGSERIFRALAEGGEVRAPLTRTFFSPSFGMVADRFGVLWMVYVEG